MSKRQQGSETVGPASKSLSQNAEGNSSAARIPKDSSLHEVGKVRRQTTPQQSGAINAYTSRGRKVHDGCPSGSSSVLHQPRAANQYTGLVSNHILFSRDTMNNKSAQRGVQEQGRQTQISSPRIKRESRRAPELQPSPYSPNVLHDSPKNPEFLYTTRSAFTPKATPSPSSSAQGQMTSNMARKSKRMPLKNYKSGSAEKHYLETRDGQLFHKMDGETEWRKSKRRPVPDYVIFPNHPIDPAIKHADAWQDLLRESESKSYYRK